MSVRERAAARHDARCGQSASSETEQMNKRIDMHVHLIDEDVPANNTSCCITDLGELKEKTGQSSFA